jgi:hypothetical protein
MEKPVVARDAGGYSNISAPASATPDKPGLAEAGFQPSTASGEFPAKTADHTESASEVAPVAENSRYNTAWTAENVPGQQDEKSGDATGGYAENPVSAETNGQAQGGLDVGGSVTSEPAQETNAKVPLSFTTSAEGATPEQAAALGQLQHDFVDGLGPNPDPKNPQYGDSWKAAQTLNDSNYRQKFGWQAFVQAQLAQYQDGVR